MSHLPAKLFELAGTTASLISQRLLMSVNEGIPEGCASNSNTIRYGTTTIGCNESS
jgi:hypothetical protein